MKFVCVILAAALAIVNGIKVNYIPMFDYDGNLLTTDANLKVEHLENGVWVPRNISSAEWSAIVQANDTTYRESTIMDFYWDYSDKAGDDAFEIATLRAAENESNFGPAYPFWRQHILNGIPYSIITARSHDAVNVKRAMNALMRKVFTEEEQHMIVKNFLAGTAEIFGYYDKEGWWKSFFSKEENIWNTYMRGCQFFPVSNEWLEGRSECGSATGSCKAQTVKSLVANALPYKTRGEQPQITVMSFFDDEQPNIEAVYAIMSTELVVEHPEICFRVYDTSDLKGTAKQLDIGSACKDIPVGDDWQSQFFLKHYKGVRSFV